MEINRNHNHNNFNAGGGKMSELQHETWEERHAGKIAGSDISKILGVNPFATGYDAWLRIKGKAVKQEENLAMYAGRIAEPFITQLYCRKMGVPEQAVAEVESGEYTQDGVSIVYSPDRIVDGNTVLELKNVGRRSAKYFGDDGDPDGFPAHYRCQALVYAYLTGAKNAVGVAYFGGDDLRCYPLERDAEMEAAIITAAIDWGKAYILTDAEPPFEYSDSALATVMSRFNRGADGVVTASSYQDAVMRGIKEIDSQIAELTKKKDTELAKLMANLPADTKTLAGEFGKLTIFQRAGTAKWKEVAEEIAVKAGIDAAELATIADAHKGKPSTQKKITYKED